MSQFENRPKQEVYPMIEFFSNMKHFHRVIASNRSLVYELKGQYFALWLRDSPFYEVLSSEARLNTLITLVEQTRLSVIIDFAIHHC